MPKFTQADIEITASDKTGPGIKGAGKSLKSFGQSVNNVGKKMSLFVTGPLVAMGAIALKNAADFEKQQVAFETMLGSAEKASALLKDLVAFSAKTPFQLPGLQDAAKRLLGFGI
jgi:phage tail tape-measure protein